MRGKLIGAASLALAVAGCAHRPEIPANNKGDLHRLVRYLQCEMYEARDTYRKQGDRLRNMGAAFELSLKADRTVGGGLSAITGLIPMSAGSIFIDGGLAYGRKDARTASVKFMMNLGALKGDACDDARADTGETWVSPFGVRDWLDSVFAAFDKDDQLTSVSYTIEFVIERSAGVRPGLRVVRLEPTAELAWKHTDTHTLQVAIEENKKPEVAHVIVDNFPGGFISSGGASPRLLASANNQRKRVFVGELYRSTVERLNRTLDNSSLQNSIRSLAR
jgi:hypothetical protein